jgi:hypothetical protein
MTDIINQQYLQELEKVSGRIETPVVCFLSVPLPPNNKPILTSEWK